MTLGALMNQEMNEQPAILVQSIARWEEDVASIQAILPPQLLGVVFVGRGSSDNAATIGRYTVEAFTGIPASLAAPSLSTRYAPGVSYENYLVVALSQSGGTPEIIAAAKAVTGKGSRLISITNNRDSELGSIADLHLFLGAGVEKAVPATKTVTAQILSILAITSAIALSRGLPSPISQDELEKVPVAVQEILDNFEPVRELVSRWKNSNRLQVVGRGLVYGAILEAALKIKETTGVFSQGISCADLVHGPIAAIDPQLPVLIFDSGERNSEELVALTQRLEGMGADVATSSADQKSTLPLPNYLPEVLNAFSVTVRGQQLSYEWALQLGRNPDSPEGLSKMTLTY